MTKISNKLILEVEIEIEFKLFQRSLARCIEWQMRVTTNRFERAKQTAQEFSDEYLLDTVNHSKQLFRLGIHLLEN